VRNRYLDFNRFSGPVKEIVSEVDSAVMSGPAPGNTLVPNGWKTDPKHGRITGRKS